MASVLLFLNYMCWCSLGLTPEQTNKYFGNRAGLYGICTAVKGKFQYLSGIGD